MRVSRMVLDVVVFKHGVSPPAGDLLHLVEHVREGSLELQGLLDLVRTDERIFAIFKEARAMMVTDKLDECRGVRFPIFRKALQIFEDGVETGGRKEANPSRKLSKSVSKMPMYWK